MLAIPGLTSFLAKGDFNAPLTGVKDLQKQYTEKYGPRVGDIDFVPNLAVTYWAFRLMIGFAVVLRPAGPRGPLVHPPGPGHRTSAWFGRLGVIALPMPFLAAEFGWIFTEMGRQPWIVAPNPNPEGVDGVWLATAKAVSGGVVHSASVIISLVAFTLLYLVCAVVWFKLLPRYAIEGVADIEPDVSPDANSDSTTPVRCPSPTERAGVSYGDHCFAGRLVPADRGPVDRLPRPRGLRLRRRHAPARPRASGQASGG